VRHNQPRGNHGIVFQLGAMIVRTVLKKLYSIIRLLVLEDEVYNATEFLRRKHTWFLRAGRFQCKIGVVL